MTRRIQIFFFLAAFIFSFSHCSSKKKVVKPSSPGTVSAPAPQSSGVDTANKSFETDSVFAFIQRTPCYGKCPVYTFTVYKSGYAVYHGERNVERTGIFSTWFSQEEIKKIIAEAEKISYFNLKESYVDKGIADLPRVMTFLNINGKKKSVENDNHEAVEGLKAFELFLDALAEEKMWTMTGKPKD